jgi:hypothetical protein
MSAKRTVTFKLITAAEFRDFFRLDSAGFYVACEAVAAGEVAEAIDAIEIIVLANKLYEVECRQRLAAALKPYGKEEQYLASVGTDRASRLVVEILGRDKVVEILREVMRYVKRQSHVGTGENDKA